ncbi:MAG TPA: ParB N-terminal domain-containing protein [Syntrophorhabdaceae bacterium]|nr:ParB N-terminal domain-containing protein [Syntrophorhabdaceae bacterium]
MYRKQFNLKMVSIEEININDRSFCISYPDYNERLTASIKKIGIIQPLIVKNQSPFVVVSGFKRLKSAINLGMERVSCVIFDITDIEACIISINENLFREMNLVEKAHSINMALNFGFSMEEIYDVMEQIGMGRHENIVRKMIKIANSEEMLKDYIVEHNVSLKNVDYLLWFEPEDRERIMNLTGKIHFTESLLREILQMLTLIKIKTDDLPYEELNALNSPYEIKEMLKKRINPGIKKLEEEFKNLVRDFKLPNNVNIKIDPFFEKEYIDIMIKAKDTSELEGALKSLIEPLKSKDMEAIFGLTKNRIPE